MKLILCLLLIIVASFGKAQLSDVLFAAGFRTHTGGLSFVNNVI